MSHSYIDFSLAQRWVTLSHATNGAMRANALLDGFRLIEALLLHESPAIPTPRPYEGIFRGDPLLGPFIDAGILSLPRSTVLESAFGVSKSEAEAVFGHNGGVVAGHTLLLLASLTESMDGYTFIAPTTGYWTLAETICRVVIEEPASLAAANLTWLVPENAAIARKRLQAMRKSADYESTLLLDGYKDLEQYTNAVLGDLKRLGRPVPLLIPPVAAVVLDSTAKREKIGEVALDLRYDLTPARSALEQREQIITDDTLPIGESLAALKSVQTALDAQLKVTNARPLVTMANSGVVKDAIKLMANGATAGGIAGVVGAIAGESVRAVDRIAQKHEVLYMATLKDRFLEIRNFGTMIDRLFGFSLSDADVSMAEENQSYAASVPIQRRWYKA